MCAFQRFNRSASVWKRCVRKNVHFFHATSTTQSWIASVIDKRGSKSTPSEIVANRLEVRQNGHMLLAGVENDLVGHAPLMQLGLARSHLRENRLLRGAERESLECVQIIGKDDNWLRNVGGRFVGDTIGCTRFSHANRRPMRKITAEYI